MDYELNIYSDIADSDDGWFASEDTMTPNKFSKAVADCKKGDTLSIRVNSPGGSVFAAATITSIITSLKQKGVTVNAYVDGLAASATSFLIMSADHVYAYPASMLMVHKPMTFVIGNADELLEEAELLEKIEESTCMPMYMSKAKIEKEEMSALIAAETWMSATDMSEVFDIEIIDGEAVTDRVDPERLKNYKRVPQQLLAAPAAGEKPAKQEDPAPEPEAVADYYYDLLERAIKAI